MTFRELAFILVIVAVAAGFVWWETDRSEALLSATAIMLGIFAFAGAITVIAA